MSDPFRLIVDFQTQAFRFISHFVSPSCFSIPTAKDKIGLCLAVIHDPLVLSSRRV